MSLLRSQCRNTQATKSYDAVRLTRYDMVLAEALALAEERDLKAADM